MSEKEKYERRKKEHAAARKEKIAKQWHRRVLKWITDPNFLIQVFMLLLTAGLIGVGYLQWGTFEKSDQTLRIVQRPWISVEIEPASDLAFKETSAGITLRYTLKNYGHSPAVNVIVWPKIIRNTFSTFAPEEVKSNCQHLTNTLHKHGNEPPFLMGRVIFPGESVKVEAYQSVDAPPVPEPPRPPVPSAYSPVFTPPQITILNPNIVTVRQFVIVVSCIDYQSSLESEHHQTAEARELMRIYPGTTNAFDIDLHVHDTIPVENLTLRPGFMWDGKYAN